MIHEQVNIEKLDTSTKDQQTMEKQNQNVNLKRKLGPSQEIKNQKGDRENEEDEDEDEEKEKEKEKEVAKKKKRRGAQTKEEFDQYSSLEYTEWVPPKNQTGDGRTSLNDKFGY